MRTLFAAIVWLAVPALAAAQTAAGLWQGAIDIPGAPLAINIRLTSGADGTWSGTVDIPAQGASNLPLSDIAVNGAAVKFTLAVPPAPSATFTGALSADGNTLSGRFAQAKAEFSFSLTRNATGVVRRTPRKQEPVPPLPYDVHEVAFDGPPGVRLAGTLTVPRTAGPHPAAVLISGSGAQDRDETIYDHKPFLVLADHLTRHGIAVLRYDDRGFGASTGPVDDLTTEELARDASAALAFLVARPEVDAARAGFIGHSEGGLTAAIAAGQGGKAAFVVLLGTAGVVGEQLLYQQAEALGRAMGAPPEQLAQGRALQEQLYAIVKTEKDIETMRTRLRALNGDASAQLLTTPWFRFFLTYDPAVPIRALKSPVLALNGELDLQVPYKENLAAIEAALKAGGNDDVTIRSLPGLNHLFQPTKTGGLPMEYGAIPETFSPTALDAISSWILERVK